MRLEDGKGTGNEAEVKDHKLQTSAVTHAEQHNVSKNLFRSFQVSTEVNITTSEQTVMIVTNDSNDDMVIPYIRIMSAGAASISSDAYFRVLVGGKYVSGGNQIESVNVNVGKTIPAEITAYSGTTAVVDNGEFDEIDKNYAANSMERYRKEGALILPKGGSLLISHKGSTAAGKAYCRVSFYFDIG